MNILLRRLRCAAWATLAAGTATAQDSKRGPCDASAAVALGQGHVVVADDEADVLRIDKRGTAIPVGAVDLVDDLHNRKPSDQNVEADIEGAAAIGQRVDWISSPARKGQDGDVEAHRRRLFATDIFTEARAPSVRAAAGVLYEPLLDDRLADPRFVLLAEAARHGPEPEGGLNIEGLAGTQDGSLLIGFRNPLPQGRSPAPSRCSAT